MPNLTKSLMGAAFAMGLSTAAFAQQPPAIDDTLLEAFAEAAVELQAIQEDFDARMATADTMESREALADERIETMVQTIEANPDITLEEYNMIVTVAAQDQALTERLVAMIEAARGS